MLMVYNVEITGPRNEGPVDLIVSYISYIIDYYAT